MHRFITSLSMFALLVLLAGGWAADRNEKVISPPRAKEGEALAQTLAQPIKNMGFDDPKTTLSEALEALAKKWGVRFVLNEKAFQFENVMDVAKTEIATPQPLRAMKDDAAGTLLNRILSRIPVPSGGRYLVRKDHIEITTGRFAEREKDKKSSPPKTGETPKPESKTPESLATRLFRRVDFSGYDDPRTTLADALDDLSKKYNLTFLLNEKAFKFENIMDVSKTEVALPNPMAPMSKTRIDVILRQILGRIPVPSGATFLVRRDVIEITSGTFLQGEVWFDDPEGPHLPVVQVVVDKQPFDEVLKSLAEQSHFNILIDTRASEKAKTPMSVELYNVPLDTAVRLLAGMVELRPVQVDNVLFVTRPETAEAMEKAKPKKPQPNLNVRYSWMISGPSGTLIRLPND